MKLFLFSLLFASSSAFLHSAQVRFGTTLQVKSNASTEALGSRTSSKIGKVAWDIIEQIDAIDTRIVWKRGHKEAAMKKTKYEPMPLDSIEAMQEKNKQRNPILNKAVGKAEIASEWWGGSSEQARHAWEVVEDIAAHDMSEVMSGGLVDGDECLLEEIEACEAMEELKQVLFIAQKAKKNQ